MKLYRLFIFDRTTRKVEQERAFRAANDDIALQLSDGWRSDYRAELWCSDRRVGTWAQGKRRSLSAGQAMWNRLRS